MVNREWKNKDQVDVFVKCLRVVLEYRSFYKNKPKTAKNKGFRTYVELLLKVESTISLKV